MIFIHTALYNYILIVWLNNGVLYESWRYIGTVLAKENHTNAVLAMYLIVRGSLAVEVKY